MKKLICFIILSTLSTLSFGQPLKKLTVVLDWFPNPDHAPLIVAQQLGFFKDQGLDVKLIGPSDPTDPPKWVAIGKADIGITYEPEFMEQVDRGLPLTRIGTLIDKPLDCIIALKESGIQTIADLKGKRIGTGSSGLTSIMLQSALTSAGLNKKDITLINVRYNLTQSLLSRKVDAITGVMRNFEIPQLELAGHKVITFFPEDLGIPTYSVLIFIAHTSHLSDDRFPKFLSALKEAVAYLDKNPHETWKKFIQVYPENNNAVNKEAWFNTLPYFAEDPGALDKIEWRRFAEFMFKHKMIKKIQPVSRYAVELPETSVQLTRNETRVIPR